MSPSAFRNLQIFAVIGLIISILILFFFAGKAKTVIYALTSTVFFFGLWLGLLVKRT